MKQTPSLFSKALHASQDWDLLASPARKSGREASQESVPQARPSAQPGQDSDGEADGEAWRSFPGATFLPSLPAPGWHTAPSGLEEGS